MSWGWPQPAIPSDGPRRFGPIDGPSFKRSLFGYRPADVEREFAERARARAEMGGRLAAEEERVKRLEVELGAEREGAQASERRVQSLQADLQLARAEAVSNARGLAQIGLELEELRASARGRATRIRLDALRDATSVAARVQAIAGADPENADRLLAALEAAVERVAAGVEEERGAVPGAGAGDAVSPVVPSGAAAGVGDASNGDPAAAEANGKSVNVGSLKGAVNGEAPNGGVNGGSPNGGADGREIKVDIGPFHDFSQLIRFEDAANSIAATTDISIRRFSGGRASIDVSLSEPVDLLYELEQSCDLEFEVRKTQEDEIVLDLGE